MKLRYPVYAIVLFASFQLGQVYNNHRDEKSLEQAEMGLSSDAPIIHHYYSAGD